MATDTRTTRKEQRQQRREEARRRQLEAERRAKRTRWAMWGIVALLIVLGAALAAGPIMERLNSQPAQGQQFPDQGRDHVNPGQPHAAYNSNPPTSGPHYPDWARWGVHERPVPDEQLVHNLEHGGIVVHYNCPDGCPETVEQLKALVGGYRSKVLLAPRPDPTVPCRITLTAWTWMDCMQEFDAGRIEAFIRAHKDRGPELVPD